MGNVCGCVRAHKEEYYIDPNKAPLGSAKHSPGRRFFKRKRSDRKKETENDNGISPTDVVTDNKESSHLSGSVQPTVTTYLPCQHEESQDLSKNDSSFKPSVVETLLDCDLLDTGDRESEAAEGSSLEKCRFFDPDGKLSSVNIPNELTFHSLSGPCDTKTAAHSSTGDLCIGPWTSRADNDQRSNSDADVLKKEGSSEHLFYARYYSVCDKDYVTAFFPHFSKDGSASSFPPQRTKISDIHVTGESEDMSAKEKLLLWTQQTTEGYGGIRCQNFTTCWRDGRLFNAIIHRYRPDLVDMDTVAVQSNIANLDNAFYVAEKLGVTRLLDPEDVDVSSPDEKSIITYVASMYDAFPKTPEGGEGIPATDVEVKWIEYQNMVNYLTQWIRHHVLLMSERNFPNDAAELKALYQQYLKFKENEIPPKETEKSKIKHFYTLLEPWIEFGRIKLCQGYHPNDLEREWGKLIIAMFEREKALRPEIERLEMLQQIANRVQRDSLGCEDKLILARNGLLADRQRIESGIQLQNEAEIAGYLIECENLLRQQLVDVQSLVDGKYQQADHIVQRVASLRDELLTIRNEYSSVYSKGRMLTSDQTKLMISGISQSLNSGFSQSLNPAMNAVLNPSMNTAMGSIMGNPMGSIMGNPMGSAMGSSMGSAMGSSMGSAMGSSMGSAMGSSMGSAMGSSMGNAFGSATGSSMGSAMGSAMNSSLSRNMGLAMTPASLTSGLSQGFNSHMSPAMSPTFPANFNPGLIPNYANGMNTNALQSLKLMQIKKPSLKSSFADQNLPEEEANVKFVQDLLTWVEEMQVQLDRAEWGSDLSSIESHLDNHRTFHSAIEEFDSSVKEAKMSKLQVTGNVQSSYFEYMQQLESQYAKLLSTSRSRHKHLDSLQSFVTRATRELIWLNEKEEEEVSYDWSERNQNISSKKDYHADLMRELDHKEEDIKSVQDAAEQMLLQNHPARSTIEAYKAAMQTQWNWILQLCHCVEQHIRQNTAYFEYFNETREALDYLKGLKDTVLRKYSCDKSTSLHKLEDLVQESMEEKEQLLQYKSKVAGLVGKAKTVVQLKPRNPENHLKGSIPIRAICDYRQIEITVYKDDECVLASNSHRAKWKVISPSGNEAMVPAVCFTVPAPNKEAVELANRIEQMYQNVLSLWHESHVNMKSTVSWHYLMNEIEMIRSSKVSSIKTLLPGEHQQVMGNLKARFDEFIEDSQESKMYSMSEIGQLEREVNVCRVYYEDLLKSAEREEQEESIYNLYVTEIRNFRLRLENCDERLIRQIRTPLDRDDIHESVMRISEQEKLKKELDHLKVDLSTITENCEEFFSQAAASTASETLRKELNFVTQNMNQAYSMSFIYLEKLRTINMVLKNTQGAESLVKMYETNLCEEDAVTAERSSIERLVSTLKQWRSEVDQKRAVFHELEDELQKAKAISDQMFKTHKERDLDFDWHKEKADQIAERWQNVHLQLENRLRDLSGISTSIKYYKESYLALDSWIRQVQETQSMLQGNVPDSSKALSMQLDQLKSLISEIEMKQSKMDECQKYSEQYSTSVKDYELQLMTYRAMVDSHQKSPMKRRRMQSSADLVIQEYMDLRNRYNALMTLMTQFVKFSGDALKRMEEEETLIQSGRSSASAHPELLEQQKVTSEENKRLLKRIQELEQALEEVKRQKYQYEQELPKIKAAADMEVKKYQKTVEEITLLKTKAEYEAQQFRVELENAVKQKTAVEQQLEHLRQITFQSESKRNAVEDKLKAFKSQIEESTTARRKLEDHLKRKDIDVQELEHEKISLMAELKRKAEIEEELLRQMKHLEHDLKVQKKMVEKEKIELETKRRMSDSRFSFSSGKEIIMPARATVQEMHYMIESDIRGSQVEQYAKRADTLKAQLDELTLVHKKAENEIKQYKSELSTFQVQKATAEEKNRQLRIQMDDTHSILQQLKIELEQKNQQEQSYVLQLRELERKLYQSQDKADEAVHDLSELRKMRISYEEELKSFQQDKLALEHKLKLQKKDYDEVRDKLKTCQEELRQKDMSERNSQQKFLFLEEDLTRKKQEVDDFRKRVDELVRLQAKAETSVKYLNTQVSSLQQEKTSLEQRSQSQSGESDNFREQLKRAQEELHQNSRFRKDDQHKISKLQDDLTKSNQWSESLKSKLDELTKTSSETEMAFRRMKSDFEKVTMEKTSLQKNLDMVKTQLDSTKEQMKMTNEQLQKQSKGEHEAHNMVKRLEDELTKSKNALNDIKQKFDKQNLVMIASEKEVRTLKSEVNNLTIEKKMADQKIQLHQGNLQEVNTKLKKVQDDLQKKTVDEQLAQKKLTLYHEESVKYKNSADEVRKKLEKTVESSISTETDFSKMKREVSTLKQERSMLEDKLKLTKIEVSDMQERLRRCQEQLNHEKKLELEHVQKCHKLEDEVASQRQAFESLKQKMDMQKQEHINQLRYIQNEVQQNSTKIPLQKTEHEMKSSSHVYSTSGSQHGFDQFGLKSPTSPVMRRKLDSIREGNSSVFKSEHIEEKKLHMDGYDDTIQKELQLQLSRIKQSLDGGDSKPPFTEFVTQTSTELQISIDNVHPYRQLSEIESSIKDKSIKNALQTLRIGEDKFGRDLGKFEQPMEMLKSKQYDVLLEVTTVKQEKEFLINNEDQGFEERNILEGFRKGDLPKIGYMTTTYRNYAGSDSLSDCSSTDDRFVFQGLRNNVSARKMVEAKILDAKTMEQLELGLTTVQEVQKTLEKYLKKATAISGLYIESSKEKISFTLAAKKGIIDRSIAFEFLEAQVVTGFIIDPSTGKTYSAEEAIANGLIDQEFKEKLLDAEKAVLGYIHSGKKLSVFQAIEARLLERQKGKRILEAQIATGGVIDPIRSIRIPAEIAVLKGLLNHTSLKFLHEPASNVKGFHFPTNKQNMYYSELLEMSVLDLESKTYLLPIGERNITAFSADKGHKICIVDLRSGSEFTRLEAYGRGLIDQKVYFELSQQECLWETSSLFDSNGSSQTLLTDKKSGRQFIIDEAVSKGLIDRTQFSKFKEGQLSPTELADILINRTRPSKDPYSPVAGYWLYETNERVSLFKALRRNMVDRVTVFRCLEAQASTGGIVDPSNGKKYNVAQALQKGLIDEVCAKQIQQCELAFIGVPHSISKGVITVAEAMDKNLFNKEIGYRCLEYQYVTGGLIDPRSNSRLSLEEAIRKGVVDAATATKLKDEKSYAKTLTCPKTRRKLSYKDAVDKAVYDCHTGLRLVEAPLPRNFGIPSLYFSSQ